MSSLLQSPSAEKYTNPVLVKKQSTIFNYDKKPRQGESEDFPYLQNQSILVNYPKTAQHARHPILVACDQCQKLTMTQTEQQFGNASLIWCTVLLPVFCMGLCCICSDTCKDIRHICSECRKTVGVNSSDIC